MSLFIGKTITDYGNSYEFKMRVNGEVFESLLLDSAEEAYDDLHCMLTEERKTLDRKKIRLEKAIRKLEEFKP